MDDELVFYTHPMSRARMVWWMLEEVGADYDTRVVEYGEEMKSREYRAINPMGKVPTIVHGGKVITECAAICAYLADAFPDAGLAPEPADRAAYYRWLFFGAGPVEMAFLHHQYDVEFTARQEVTVGYGNHQRMVDTLSTAIEEGGDYIAADRFTAADVYVGSHVGYGLRAEALPKLPVFEDYWERLKSRDAHSRAQGLAEAQRS